MQNTQLQSSQGASGTIAGAITPHFSQKSEMNVNVESQIDHRSYL